MSRNPDDSRPPYLQVAALLRDAITSGQYKPGEQLPSRAQLTAWYEVSAMTVQNALRELRDEGLIVSRQGQGVFVRTRADTGPEARLRTARRVLGELHRPISTDDRRCHECRDALGAPVQWPCATHRHLAPILDQQ